LIISKNNEMPNQARYNNNILEKYSWLVHLGLDSNTPTKVAYHDKKTENLTFLRLLLNIINIQPSGKF
jgi:hypothetical protein